MNKRLFISMLTGFVMTVLGVTLSSCKEESPTSKIIQKSYTTMVKLEDYVSSLDATNLVNKVKMLKGPLETTVNALTFMVDRVESVDLKENMVKIISSIQSVLFTIELSNDEQVVEIKNKILDSVSKAKETIVKVAKILKVELVNSSIRVGIGLESLSAEFDALNQMIIDENKKSLK